MSDRRTVSLEFLLKRVARARADGDLERARPDWEACVVRATPRVRSAVTVFRTGNGDRVAADDREAVVNDALERATRRMVETLEQLTEPVFLAAMWTCAENACRDHFRRLGAYRKGLAGSLDDPAPGDGEGSRYDADLHREAVRRAGDEEGAFEALDRVERALAAMTNEQRRKAVEMRRLGCEYEEIAEALQTSRANAYQLVCRGLADLGRLMEP